MQKIKFSEPNRRVKLHAIIKKSIYNYKKNQRKKAEENIKKIFAHLLEISSFKRISYLHLTPS